MTKMKFTVTRIVLPRLLQAAYLPPVSDWPGLRHVAWQRKFELQSETYSIYTPEMEDIAAKRLRSANAVDRSKWRGNEPWSVWQPSGTSVGPQRRYEHTEPRCGFSR